MSRTEDELVVRTYCQTPAGSCGRRRCIGPMIPVVTRQWIKDLKRVQAPAVFFPDPKDADDEEFQQAKRLIGDDAVVGFWVHYPALMFDYRDGHENVYYDYYDNYDLVM